MGVRYAIAIRIALVLALGCAGQTVASQDSLLVGLTETVEQVDPLIEETVDIVVETVPALETDEIPVVDATTSDGAGETVALIEAPVEFVVEEPQQLVEGVATAVEDVLSSSARPQASFFQRSSRRSKPSWMYPLRRSRL